VIFKSRWIEILNMLRLNMDIYTDDIHALTPYGLFTIVAHSLILFVIHSIRLSNNNPFHNRRASIGWSRFSDPTVFLSLPPQCHWFKENHYFFRPFRAYVYLTFPGAAFPSVTLPLAMIYYPVGVKNLKSMTLPPSYLFWFRQHERQSGYQLWGENFNVGGSNRSDHAMLRSRQRQVCSLHFQSKLPGCFMRNIPVCTIHTREDDKAPISFCAAFIIRWCHHSSLHNSFHSLSLISRYISYTATVS